MNFGIVTSRMWRTTFRSDEPAGSEAGVRHGIEAGAPATIDAMVTEDRFFKRPFSFAMAL